MPLPTALGQSTTINGRAMVSALINGTTFGWVPAATPTGERWRFMAAMPTLADLSDDEQALIVSGDLQGMIFERVSGVITYRGQLPVYRTTVFDTLARRNAVAAALLAGVTTPLGSGVAGPNVFRYMLLQDDAANSATAGIYSITAYDGPFGVQDNYPELSGGGAAAAVDLDYTPGVSDGVVTNSAGEDATIPLATATNAGLLGAAAGIAVRNALDTFFGGGRAAMRLWRPGTITTAVGVARESGAHFVFMSTSWADVGQSLNLIRFTLTLSDPGQPNDGRVIVIEGASHAANPSVVSDSGGTPAARLTTPQLSGTMAEWSFRPGVANDVVLTSNGSVDVALFVSDSAGNTHTVNL